MKNGMGAVCAVVLAFALAGTASGQSTNYSTNLSFLTSFNPSVFLPQFNAAAIGSNLGQTIVLESVTLTVTGTVSGTLTATNTAVGPRDVTSLRIETILFTAQTTNLSTNGVDLAVSNGGFLSPDVASPDFSLASFTGTNFPNVVSPAGSLSNAWNPSISDAVRSAYTGAGNIEILLAASAQFLGSAADGVQLGLEEATANMAVFVTYTWSVIPEPSTVAAVIGAGVFIAVLRRRRK